MTRQELQRYFYDVHIKYYGDSSHRVKLPFFGGHLELDMSFNNGMIDLHGATSNVMGVSSRCDYFSLGYTDTVGLARSAAVALEKLEDSSRSQLALMKKEEDLSSRVVCLGKNPYDDGWDGT
jgi:hypothetical protein